MSSFRACSLALLAVAASMLVPAAAQASTTIDIRGKWVGTSEAGGSTYSGETFIETEDCAAGTWTGHSYGNGYTIDDRGTIDGNHITSHQDYENTSYKADGEGTISTDSQGRLRNTGTFHDTNGVSGTADSTRVEPGPDDGGCAAQGQNPNPNPDPTPTPDPSNPPPPSGAKRPTVTLVICTYDVLTSVDTCTATVGDKSGTAASSAPTGQVSFASTRGLFLYGSVCNLVKSPYSTNSSTCTVAFLPPDRFLPAITASYQGDGDHLASSDQTQYRGTNGAATYETPGQAKPSSYANQIGISTPIAANGTGVQACVVSAGGAAKGAGAAGATPLLLPSPQLTIPQLEGISAKVEQVLGRADFSKSIELQQSVNGMLGKLFGGLPSDPQERADAIRMPFFKDIGDAIGTLLKTELSPLQPDLQPFSNLFVENVMDSIPADPDRRAADLRTQPTQALLETIAKIAKAQHAACTQAAANIGLRVGFAEKARARRGGRGKSVLLATATRRNVKAGKLKLTMRLKHGPLARLTKHRKSLAVVVRVNLVMPSATLTKGYPRAVVETLTLHRGKKRRGR